MEPEPGANPPVMRRGPGSLMSVSQHAGVGEGDGQIVSPSRTRVFNKLEKKVAWKRLRGTTEIQILTS